MADSEGGKNSLLKNDEVVETNKKKSEREEKKEEKKEEVKKEEKQELYLEDRKRFMEKIKKLIAEAEVRGQASNSKLYKELLKVKEEDYAAIDEMWKNRGEEEGKMSRDEFENIKEREKRNERFKKRKEKEDRRRKECEEKWEREEKELKERGEEERKRKEAEEAAKKKNKCCCVIQ